MQPQHRDPRMILDVIDAIYIINLKTRTDRLKEMQEQFARIGVDILDARSKVIVFEAVRPSEAGEFPTIGTRGCFMSHLGVLEDAIRKGFERVLICEDDLDFSEAFISRQNFYARWFNEQQWDLFYLGYGPDSLEIKIAESLDVHRFYADEFVQNLHFVALNGSVIAKLADFLKKMLQRKAGSPDGGPMHVDGAYNWYRKVNTDTKTWAAVPVLGVQRASRTDIHELRWFDKFSLTSMLINRARNLKNKIR
jgi:glycosyl transferase, family 25